MDETPDLNPLSLRAHRLWLAVGCEERWQLGEVVGYAFDCTKRGVSDFPFFLIDE